MGPSAADAKVGHLGLLVATDWRRGGDPICSTAADIGGASAGVTTSALPSRSWGCVALAVEPAQQVGWGQLCRAGAIAGELRVGEEPSP